MLPITQLQQIMGLPPFRSKVYNSATGHCTHSEMRLRVPSTCEGVLRHAYSVPQDPPRDRARIRDTICTNRCAHGPDRQRYIHTRVRTRRSRGTLIAPRQRSITTPDYFVTDAATVIVADSDLRSTAVDYWESTRGVPRTRHSSISGSSWKTSSRYGYEIQLTQE